MLGARGDIEIEIEIEIGTPERTRACERGERPRGGREGMATLGCGARGKGHLKRLGVRGAEPPLATLSPWPIAPAASAS
jgi:hypothetical protein